MRVLLVDGFVEPHEIVDASRRALSGRHDVTDLGLLEAGFDRYMSADERAAYHDTDNLITAETRESADLIRSHDALLVCGPLVAGAISPLVKSWFERVFIPEVSFTFTERGRVTGALTNIRRVGMIVHCPTADRAPHRFRGSTRSVLRGVRMNASRLCRTTYVPVTPGDSVPDRVSAGLRRW